MGASGPGRGNQSGGRSLSGPAARVVPGVPTFAVDQGFWYSVPGHLESVVAVGSIVRVPLGGRKTRGFVVEMAHDREGPLREISAVSGDRQVFGEAMLHSLQWAANHYVAPMAVVLERAAPPNLPRSARTDNEARPVFPVFDHPLRRLATGTAAGLRRPPVAIVTSSRENWLAAIGPVLEAGASALVVLATAAETGEHASAARRLFGEHVVEVAGETASALTAAWGAAQVPGRLVVGTPRAACWQIDQLALVVVVEEGRRAMKDRQTPTIHVRDLLLTRSRVEGFSLAFLGPTPSIEVLAAGAEIVRVGSRAWPLVEVVDRTAEPPGSGYLSDRSLAALRAVSESGGRCFVFTHRRLSDASARCTVCRRVRVCQNCGSRLGTGDTCRRCGAEPGSCPHCGSPSFEDMGSIPERLAAEVNRSLGDGVASVGLTDLAVGVGTERDLAALGEMDLVVAADADGLMLGSDYRAGEEALRVLARLAGRLRPGPGRRMIVQTSMAESDLIVALRRGDPIPHLEKMLSERARLGLPPASEMIAVEIRGAANDADAALRDLGVTVLGPASTADHTRWLLQGDLGRARLGLRKLVQTWRDGGSKVRIDADPIDL